MYEFSKLEFGKWLAKQNIEELTCYEKSMIGIIIDHFDEIAQCGTARGGRARLIGKYIEALGNNADRESLQFDDAEVKADKVKRLSSLEIEKFRGFGNKENFDFETQYTFYHGPNGSGKTSFCEALEYSILGTIAEATVRNISVEKYITHVGEKSAVKPKLLCELSDGTISDFKSSLSDYRFAFIEKNRILDFSHIGAATAKNQSERIAALFGLSEFQSFVSDFTDSFDGRYLKLDSDIKQKLENRKENFDKLLKQKKRLDNDIDSKREELQERITKLDVEEVKTAEEAIIYLTDSEKGAIPKASKLAIEKKMNLIEADKLEYLVSLIRNFLDSIDEIQTGNKEILDDIGSTNLLELYKKVVKLKDTYVENVCPICRTPFEDAKENPFIFSEKELDKFSKIDAAKKRVKENSVSAAEKINEINQMLSDKTLSVLLSKTPKEMIISAPTQSVDYEFIDSDKNDLITQVRDLLVYLTSEDIKTAVIEHNEAAKRNNELYANKVNVLQKIYGEISSASAALKVSDQQLQDVRKTIADEREKLGLIEEEATKTSKVVEFNLKMAQAYETVRKKLVVYVAELPLRMAKDLSEKAKVYYNVINSGDAAFEVIDELHLPVSVNDKIMVKMADGTNQDALQILSEGHIRILGLSILLAKAVSEKMPFIIFDDIVNSIDDDHRDGVASLLITHRDFSEIQMILTCHGELFVTTLESYVKDRNKMTRYMFLPADTLEERGIVIRYQDSTIPIRMAREKFEKNELKDSAAKCRQAVECITGVLWKKISPKVEGISVVLRKLQGTPDLHQVVNGLKAATKGKNLMGAEEIHELLGELVDNKTWNLLNKGTHVDETLPEFSRVEIKSLLELVERLDKSAKELKIKAAVVERSS